MTGVGSAEPAKSGGGSAGAGAGFSLLKDGRLATLLGAEVISSIGTQMTWVALPWFVLRTTGSPQRMTWILSAEMVPIAVLGFWGGAIAGRVPRVRLSVRWRRCGASSCRGHGCSPPPRIACGGFFMSLVNAPMQALSQFSTRAVIAAVLAVQSVAVLTIVGSALVERSALQGDLVDSLA